MTNRGQKQRNKRDRPTSRTEGARRVGSYLRYLFGWDAKPADLAPVVMDAALTEIAAVDDPKVRLALYREVMDRAYAAMVAS